MPASLKTQKYIWGQCAARCAICREHLIEEKSNIPSLVGEVAHIIGEKSVAPRGASNLTSVQRNAPENLLLLCLKHHKIVDDDVDTYSVERLREIRTSHIEWVLTQLAPSAPWQVRISQYCYLNVPRLDEFAALSGFEIRRQPVDNDKTLRDLGYDLNALMEAYRRTIERIAIDAIPVDKIKFAHEGYIGQLLFFDRLRWRTKNMTRYSHRGDASANFAFSGNLATDPHIYHDFGEWRLVINVNPRWVTTDTAYGMFRPSGGISTFSGFARLTQVDYETKTMIATGQAIGVPTSPLDELKARYSAEQPAALRPPLSAFEDPRTIARGALWSSLLHSCDLCGKLFSNEIHMIDGAVKNASGWACMCGACFDEHGRALGIGYGQLYRKTADGWLLVGGSLDNDN